MPVPMRWSGRLSLTPRILAVNVFALALLAGGFFYLDSYRTRIVDDRLVQSARELKLLAIGLDTAPTDRQDRLNFQDLSDSRIPNDGTPGYATFNLRLGTMISEREHVSLELENLFDKDYRVHGSGVDGAGFSANIRYLRQF